MVWYYRDNDQEIGPVSKAELQNLVKSKQIGAQTPVRNVEMTDWVPLIDVVRGKAGQPKSPPPLNMASPDDGIGELAMDTKDVAGPGEFGDTASAVSGDGEGVHLAICSQCGGTFPEDQVIAIEDRMICAACKPMFVQKLKEGVAMPLSTAFGGFWIRLLAYIIDSFVFGIVSWIILMPIGIFMMPNMMQGGNPPAAGGIFAIFGLYMLVSIGVPVFYFTFFHGRWGATVGKMACGLRVVTAEGEPITYMRAFGRFWAFMLSGIILYIGYIMAGFDDEKRALHDRICSTRVIKKR
jgi:uncharacterized RDD family membrane protein YckC